MTNENEGQKHIHRNKNNDFNVWHNLAMAQVGAKITGKRKKTEINRQNLCKRKIG